MKKKVLLNSMVRNECANYIGGKPCIITGKPCKVENDKRCNYFEKCVLPLTDKMEKYLGVGAVYLDIVESKDSTHGEL